MNFVEAGKSIRRYDLDWLRVIAFGVLIYFHTAVAFLPHGLPLTINDEPSVLISAAVAFSHNFRLSLLFFVSGFGVYCATKMMSRAEFIRARSHRLIPPLLFGIALLVPVMVFFEKKYLGEQFESFWSFYKQYYTSGVYPKGYLSWHHFWFLAYLYLMCLMIWPVVRWGRSRHGSERLNGLYNSLALNRAGLYLLVVPLLLVEIFLRPLFPGFRDLISDWASFSHWFLFMVAGCWFAADQRLLEAARVLRGVSLGLMLSLTFVLFLLFWQPDVARLYPFEGQQVIVGRFLLFSALRVAVAWLCILVCVGYAAEYLNQPSSLLTQLNQAVYPVFCLHLPVLVILEDFLLPQPWSIPVKFITISSVAILVLFCLYLLLQRVRILHPVLGLRLKS